MPPPLTCLLSMQMALIAQISPRPPMAVLSDARIPGEVGLTLAY
ncbi:unnamed protein product [marine sediment metagenome]|uniref:Uncharacterized protein n=1 Tax=marine sediment metagenome TaxID=412755 RepID=X1CJ48_9ZZZZ